MSAELNKQLSKKPPGNRLFWGALVFISGFFTPLFIPLVLNSNLSTGLKSVLSGLLAFGIPELFMIIAAGILGKSGFNYLKKYIRLVFRVYGPPDSVSKTRYIIGLILFFIPILLALVLPYMLNLVQVVAENFVIISIVSDGLLILSLFVLGGDFWDKLRGLFNRNAKMQFP